MPHAKTILHVDMDAFFASVETRENPDLADKPVLVGGSGKRGVISAANYIARTYGCHSAQPSAVAMRKCPHAVLLPPRIELYAEVSNQVFEVLHHYSPLVEGLSIDEAFLDLTGTERLLGTPMQAAHSIRAEVLATTQLTCSVGISAVKFVAKIASAFRKPDQVTLVPAGEEKAFLSPLPVNKLWGVGKKTEESLHKWGIRTVGQISQLSQQHLEQQFGRHGEHLWRLSQGMDPREVLGQVSGERNVKQISCEDTVEDDLIGEEAIRSKLLEQAARIADRLIGRERKARHVHLKIRDISFTTQTRQHTVDKPIDDARSIYQATTSLLKKIEIDKKRFRLVGTGVSGFDEPDAGAQLDLFSQLTRNSREDTTTDAHSNSPATAASLQRVMTDVRDRFGTAALFPAGVKRNKR